MSHRIRCYTLFDITKTGITNRTKPSSNIEQWVHDRNTQCNFDTLLQVISLRSQPEVVKDPVKTSIESSIFGSSINSCWMFEFEVHHSSVFDDGNTELGSLYDDCNNVPMIKTSQYDMSTFLHTSTELKNIHFEVV